MLKEITPLILTRNEASNIGRTLSKLGWAKDIVVLDSCSTDFTPEIARSFSQVRFFQREFNEHAKQWNFGLHETGIDAEWVLALDADYQVTREFLAEISSLQVRANIAGYSASFTYCVRGKQLRGTIYPPVTVLYRKDKAHYQQDGHTQRIKIEGEVVSLNAKLLHDDRKPFREWLRAQGGYAFLEAQKLLSSSTKGLNWIDRLRKFTPFAPALVFPYCLLAQRGLLDGWPGVFYAFQRGLAEFLILLKLIKLRYGGWENHRERKAADKKRHPAI